MNKKTTILISIGAVLFLLSVAALMIAFAVLFDRFDKRDVTVESPSQITIVYDESKIRKADDLGAIVKDRMVSGYYKIYPEQECVDMKAFIEAAQDANINDLNGDIDYIDSWLKDNCK